MKTSNIVVTMLAMMALFAVGVNAGTVTMVNPASSQYVGNAAVGGEMRLNATQDFNATWCAFRVYSTSTANSSTTLAVRNVTKDHTDAASNNSVNASINVRFFEDANDYVALAICENITSAEVYTSASTTGITLDSTVPDVPTVNTVAGYTDDDGALNFNATVLGNQTTGCTLRFIGTVPTGVGASVTITETSGDNLCTRAVSGPVGNGVFTYTFTANDGTNTSAETTAQQTIVTLDGNRKKSILIPTEVAADLGVSPKSKLSGTPLLILLGAGAVIAWSMFGKK